jgi:glucan phosphoethanolaminetransferase (alkaline phosphatase superfamily)
MDKNTLNKAVETCKAETRNALQLVYDNLNQGQQKKILKETAVVELFNRYGVEY